MSPDNTELSWPRIYQVTVGLMIEGPFAVRQLGTCIQMTRSSLLYVPFEVAFSGST